MRWYHRWFHTVRKSEWSSKWVEVNCSCGRRWYEERT